MFFLNYYSFEKGNEIGSMGTVIDGSRMGPAYWPMVYGVRSKKGEMRNGKNGGVKEITGWTVSSERVPAATDEMTESWSCSEETQER